MQIIDIAEAQENLEELIDQLAPGEWFIISRNGQHLVKVMALTDSDRDALEAEEKLRKSSGSARGADPE